MHAQTKVALESSTPSPHSDSGPRRLRAQRCPTPAGPAVSARGARAPYLKACLQPSSRLGLSSSPQMAWPRLQLPGWLLSWTSEDDSAHPGSRPLGSGQRSGQTEG